MKDVVIDVRGLRVGWDAHCVLLDDVTFQVKRGDVFVILGARGSGKSSLLRHLVGLERPFGGSIEVAGMGAQQLEVGRPRFGVMFQGGGLFESMTVAENVALPLGQWTNLPRDATNAIVRAKLRLVKLAGAEQKLPSEISAGMKARAAIARALALEPELLFLDEPFAGLDSAGAVELDELLLTLRRDLGLTVVLVTRELESVFRIGTRCIILDRRARGIVAQGDPRDLREHEFFHREQDHDAELTPVSKRSRAAPTPSLSE